jgi:hypothetical protein
MHCVIDIESSNLLNNESIDYTASPYKLKDDYRIWLIVAKDIDTGQIHVFRENDIRSTFIEFYKGLTTCIGHNSINFDMLAIKLYTGINYSVEPDTINGKACEIIDTLVISKTLNPDRLGGHSLDSWGKRLGDNKGSYSDWSKYTPEMEEYCIQDVNLTHKVYLELLKEKGTWPWDEAIKLEKQVAEIITRQEHRGFNFDSTLAVSCVKDLDEKLQAIKEEVEPVLPPKPLAKTAAKLFTPPATQFLKSGLPSTHLKNFIEKHLGTFSGEREVTIFGKVHALPLPQESLVTHEASTLKDTTHIKEWLVREFKWEPIQYKERDLTVNSKKQKLDKVGYEKAVTKYVEQTLASAFCKDRLEHIGCSRNQLLSKLLSKDISRPCRVLTNPTFTIGQDKEICPNLVKLEVEFPYTRKLIEFLTYSHRRNSILGGGFDPDEDEEAEKGFLANVRADGRIPTPADTCGAGTSRFKHRICANIPRATSLYGDKMRSLFGSDSECYQIGYDFDSLEAKIESHYCFKYKGGIEYGVSLTAEKPNDCHTVLASYISELINKKFPRGTAKSVKYGCSYNAQATRVAKIVGCDLHTAQVIFDAFWVQASPLKELKENMQKYWETTGQKKFLLGLDGRKLPIRSKGNVINTAFQSAGVICAKKAMVLHDRKLKEHGLVVDFFSEDYKQKTFAQQMIAYHDEAQSEVTKDLVKFKMFKTEEEGKLFREDNPTWGELAHTDKGWYSAYSLPGVLATQSVKEAGEYYKLNVELTAGYIVHKNWYGCH